MMVAIFVMPLKDAGTAAAPNFYNVPAFLMTSLTTVACYASAYFLYPRFLLKRRLSIYLILTLSISLLIALATGLASYLLTDIPVPVIWAHIVVKFFIVVFVMGTGTAYRFIMDVMKEDRKLREGMAMELSFLRSQVSPHFMFNTLNSMVALARKKSDKLEPALMELSNLMHYMLYDSDQEKVHLANEINYIQSYIDLQTLRFGHKVSILFNVHNPARQNSCIEPMLLIPLIENAFKHGIGDIEEPEIDMQLDITRNWLTLTVKNKYNPHTIAIKDKTPGIGLVNLQRRLKLLYPGKHQVSVDKSGVYYKATLKLQLHDQMPGC
ncbi:histidine kinase [Filimonas zeae]|uniref:Histidine kinase n=2 Tax=Filimonas zeae TaxID=1737353 RepID=A0A917J2K4_9BACT|nr:histidine kinase [Filimonas zeae]